MSKRAKQDLMNYANYAGEVDNYVGEADTIDLESNDDEFCETEYTVKTLDEDYEDDGSEPPQFVDSKVGQGHFHISEPTHGHFGAAGSQQQQPFGGGDVGQGHFYGQL